MILGLVFLTAIFGPMLVGNLATHIDLDNSNQAPFTLAHGWANFLGTDPLGRSMLARLIVACRTTLSVAIPAVVISAVVGSVIGMWAGYYRGWRETVAMRVADVIMSFPSLLLAVVVLYVFSPSAANIVLVLAITRIPVYLRTARAESAELQSRLFVDAARTFGASASSIIWRHVLPIVLPTLLTVATLDFCYVMLAESSLSFLGIGIQPPDVSWGLMVVAGPHLPAHRVVAVVLPRPGHRHHHGVGHHPRRLGPHRHRSRAAVAPDRPAETPVPLRQDHEGTLMTAARRPHAHRRTARRRTRCSTSTA